MSDPTMKRADAQNLARRIKKYWHDLGYKTVHVWVEPVPIYSPATNEKIATRFEINSNIVQKVPS